MDLTVEERGVVLRGLIDDRGLQHYSRLTEIELRLAGGDGKEPWEDDKFT